MKLPWKNVSVETQLYEFKLLGLSFEIYEDLGFGTWVLRGPPNSFLTSYDSIESAEDDIIECLKKRKLVVEKELKVVEKELEITKDLIQTWETIS